MNNAQPGSGETYLVWTRECAEPIKATFAGCRWIDKDGDDLVVTAFAPLPTLAQASKYPSERPRLRFLVEIGGGWDGAGDFLRKMLREAQPCLETSVKDVTEQESPTILESDEWKSIETAMTQTDRRIGLETRIAFKKLRHFLESCPA